MLSWKLKNFDLVRCKVGTVVTDFERSVLGGGFGTGKDFDTFVVDAAFKTCGLKLDGVLVKDDVDSLSTNETLDSKSVVEVEVIELNLESPT